MSPWSYFLRWPSFAIFTVALLSPTLSQASDKTICMTYPMSRFYDASPEFFVAENDCQSDSDCDSVVGAISGVCEPNGCEYDYGEDLGRSNTLRRPRYILAQVYRNDNSLAWVGYATKGGCTGSFPSGGGPFRLRVFPVYQSTVTDTRFTVKTCTGSTSTSCYTPAFDRTGIQMSGVSTATVELDPDTTLDAFIAMSNALSRFAENKFSNWNDFVVEVGRECGGVECGAAVDWPSSANFPRVTLSTPKARSKFTTVHEMAHALHLDLVGTASGIADCSYGSGNADNHTMLSPEYQSCANTEGVAHYLSAAAWNNLGTNADGHIVTFTNSSSPSSFVSWDVESGLNQVEPQCSPSCCGLATEHDWNRFYWDFRTNSGSKPDTISPPTHTNIGASLRVVG